MVKDGLLERLRNRVRWWYARTFGERPQCECGADATFWLHTEGYLCLMCYSRGQPYQGIGFVRDIQPEDYFTPRGGLGRRDRRVEND